LFLSRSNNSYYISVSFLCQQLFLFFSNFFLL